jgi:hypothetical protein
MARPQVGIPIAYGGTGDTTMVHLARNLAAGVIAASACALAGCYSAEPVGYAETTAVPVNIQTYPSVTYGGHPNYLYGGRWWYRGNGGRWVYYQREPPELYRQRTVVIRP